MKSFDLHFHVNSAGRYRVNKSGAREYIEDCISYSISQI